MAVKKLKVYVDYTKPIGTIELGDDGFLKVEADTPGRKDSIQGLAAHYAADLQSDTGKESTNAEVLERMAARMGEGKRSWCEVVE